MILLKQLSNIKNFQGGLQENLNWEGSNSRGGDCLKRAGWVFRRELVTPRELSSRC